MTTRDEDHARILEIVAEIAEVPVEKVTADAMLADLDIDSLRGLRIVAAVERRWGIVISEDAIGRIRSMRDIFALVDAAS